MLILFLTILVIIFLIKFLLKRKAPKPKPLKLKDLKSHILDTDMLVLKSMIACQIIIFIRILLFGWIIRNWGFAILEVLAKFEKINPFAVFLYNRFTRVQIYDLGEFILCYGYLVYLVIKVYRWSKRTIKNEKMLNSNKE